MSDALNAWCDGAVEPINPGGVPTYGFLVKARDTVLHSECGLAGTPFKIETTNNVAEYEALNRCLEWLLQNASQRVCVVHGDSRLIIHQVTGRWKIKSEPLKPYWERARKLVSELPHVELKHIPRDQNQEADHLTHQCYESYMDAHPEIHELLPLATPNMLASLRKKGIPTYRYMGRIDAMRLLRRHHTQSKPTPNE